MEERFWVAKPIPKGGEFICPVCEKKGVKMNNGKQIFCSPACNQAYKNLRISVNRRKVQKMPEYPVLQVIPYITHG